MSNEDQDLKDGHEEEPDNEDEENNHEHEPVHYFKINKKVWVAAFLKWWLKIGIIYISLKFFYVGMFWVNTLLLSLALWFFISVMWARSRFYVKRLLQTRYDKFHTKKLSRMELFAALQKFDREEDYSKETLTTILSYVPSAVCRRGLAVVHRPSRYSSVDAEGLTNTGDQMNVSVKAPEEEEVDSEGFVGNYKLWRWNGWLFILHRSSCYDHTYLGTDSPDDRFPEILAIQYNPESLEPLAIGTLAYDPYTEFALHELGFCIGNCYVYFIDRDDDEPKNLEKSFLFMRTFPFEKNG